MEEDGFVFDVKSLISLGSISHMRTKLFSTGEHRQ
jgi:hypothetical protein